MKLMTSYREPFDSLWFPWSHMFIFGKRFPLSDDPDRRVWRFDIAGALFGPFHGLLRLCSWYTPGFSISGSWIDFTTSLWNNVCILATPFRRPGRMLLQNIVNRNGTKLLRSDRNSAVVRTRGQETVYFDIEVGWMTCSVVKRVYRYPDGSSANMFIHGFRRTAPGATCEDPVEERTTVIEGLPCVTVRQCQEAFDRVVEATPEMEWFDD